MNTWHNEVFDGIRMTDAGKQKLIRQMTAGEKRTAPAPKRVLRTSLVAAVFACVLLATAGAIALSTPILRQYLGGGAAYGQNVQSLNLSQTVNGYTITLTDCVGDDEFLYLGIELTGPEGTVLDDTLSIGDNDETVTYSGFEGGIGSGGGWRCLPDDDPLDNKMSFVWFRWVEKPLAGRDMTITFHNLLRWTVGGGMPATKEVYAEGDWSFGPFRLSYTDRALDLTPDVKVPLLGGETTVTAVKITPLHVEVEMEGGCLVDIHSTGPEKDGCWGLCRKETTLALYGKDGVQWELPESSFVGTWINTEGDRTGMSFSYNQLLDLDELGAIEICGVMIPIGE